MKYDTIKRIEQIPVGEKLAKADLTQIDGSIKGMTLTFESGKQVMVSYSNYNFDLSVTAAPKMQDAWEVKGILLGVDLTQHFNEKSTAERYKFKLEQTEGVEQIVLNKISVSEEEKLVQSEEIPFQEVIMKVEEIDGEYYVSISHWGMIKLEGYNPKANSAHRLFGN